MEKSAAKRAHELLWLDDLDESSRVAEDEICRLGDRGNTAEIWHLRFIRSEITRLRGRTDEALRYLESQESLNSPNASDIDSHARLWMHRGYYCGLLGRYEPSHRLLAAAEETARDSGLLELLCEVYQRQAMILFRQQDYAASDRAFRTILKLADEMEGWYFRSNALWGIGKNLMIQHHYQEAMPWLNDSLKIFEDVNAQLSVATVWSELAVCHLGLGDDGKALELLEDAARRDSEAGSIHNYQVSIANIGNVHANRGDYLTAILYYKQALTLARDIRDTVSTKKWTYNIQLAYLKIRQTVDARCPRTA